MLCYERGRTPVNGKEVSPIDEEVECGMLKETSWRRS